MYILHKNAKNKIIVPQGSFDGPLVSGLKDLYLLAELNENIHIHDHNLYLNNGLIVMLVRRKENDNKEKIIQEF